MALGRAAGWGYLCWLRAYQARSRLLLVACLLLSAASLLLLRPPPPPLPTPFPTFNLSQVRIPSLAELRVRWVQKKLDRLSGRMEKLMVKKVLPAEEIRVPNQRVHIFYFSWFRNIEEDGYWNHWQIGKNGSSPPGEIDSKFYPKMGCYSSRNMTVIEEHMKLIRKAGIGVVILSWVPPPSPDSPVTILSKIINIVHKLNLKIALQIEFYENRSLKEVINQIRFFISKYGKHPAVYHLERKSLKLPVFYIHETFQVGHMAWKRFLSPASESTIRGSQYDGVFLAHLTEQHQGTLLKAANFDGFYTYSSANGLSYGSSWKNWESLAKFAKEKNLIFVPCIGPGYKGTKDMGDRLHGDYYEVGWRSALTVRPPVIGINSFNNWQEGNQIEPAVAWRSGNHIYRGYEPEGHLFYLNLTLLWVHKFTKPD